MARLSPDIGQAGVVEGVSRGSQGSDPEEHLHFLETAPIEGEEIDQVRKGQAMGTVAFLPFFAAAHPEGAALGRVFHGQQQQVLPLAKPAASRGQKRQGRRHHPGDVTQQGGQRRPPGHPGRRQAGLLHQDNVAALDNDLVVDGCFSLLLYPPL